MSEAIELNSINKLYHKTRGWRGLLPWRHQEHVTAIEDISLTVHDGEFFGLLGPNGAGKTTLIKILCGLVLPNNGQASIHGRDVVREADAVRDMIALVDGQERSFFWRLSGRENLEFFAALYGLYGSAANQRVDDLLDLVSLQEAADRRFMTYSTGMRQRLAIARGLIRRPQVLFMDEPTRSLDPLSARQVREFARDELVDRLGCTVVWCTHYLQEAEQLCDRVAIVNHGKLVACETVSGIKERISVRAACRLRVAGLSDSDLVQLQASSIAPEMTWERLGHETVLDLLLDDREDALAQALQAVAATGGRIQHCVSREPTLEEAFAYLVDGSATA